MEEVRSKLTRTDSAAENVKHVYITHRGTQAGTHTHRHTGREAEKERDVQTRKHN